MKDIIRQAVADAAEWLYQNRSAASQFWLGKTEPEHILRAYARASQFEAEKRRKEQLADFVANPVKTLSMHCDAWPESLHLAAIEGKTVTIGFDPAEATPDQLRDLAQGFTSIPVMPPAATIAARKTFIDSAAPVLTEISRRVDSALVVGPGGEIARTGGFVDRYLMVPYKDCLRERTAEAARFLWMCAPRDYSQGFLMGVSSRKIMYEFGRHFVPAGTPAERPRPMVTIRDDKGDFSQQPADDWRMQCIARGKLRAEVADHALAIWLRDGYGAPLRALAPEDILKLSLEKSGRDFNKDVELPAPSDPKWSIAVTASFDFAEGEGRVWLSAKDDDESMIAIEGRENAATLASMLIDWVRPDVVVVPRALLERLAKIEDQPNHQDNGPGYDACPDCGACADWIWQAGKVIGKGPMDHDAACALNELRDLLK